MDISQQGVEILVSFLEMLVSKLFNNNKSVLLNKTGFNMGIINKDKSCPQDCKSRLQLGQKVLK